MCKDTQKVPSYLQNFLLTILNTITNLILSLFIERGIVICIEEIFLYINIRNQWRDNVCQYQQNLQSTPSLYVQLVSYIIIILNNSLFNQTFSSLWYKHTLCYCCLYIINVLSRYQHKIWGHVVQAWHSGTVEDCLFTKEEEEEEKRLCPVWERERL